MSEPVFMFDGEDPQMKRAYEAAQRSFKLFWREVSWERRRIVPGLDMAMIKLPFTDGPRSDGNAEFEHMWCDEVDFDGEILTGILINAPNWLTSVKEGDPVRAPFCHLADWMLTADGVAYGGYTVNLMRAGMGAKERTAHDEAWGLDFGDPDQIRTVIVRGKTKKRGFLARLFGAKSREDAVTASTGEFQDHPMCVNMLGEIESQLQQDPSIASSTDEHGWSLLHREALAGNLGVVRLLLEYGADANARTPAGRSAAELARSIGWEAIAAYLSDRD